MLLDGHNIKGLQLRWLRSQVRLCGVQGWLGCMCLLANCAFMRCALTPGNVPLGNQLQMALVSQEPTLFSTSIYENIANSLPGAAPLPAAPCTSGAAGRHVHALRLALYVWAAGQAQQRC